MNNQLILITPPDDIQLDGLRILTVNLNAEQSKMLSSAFIEIIDLPTTMLYVWTEGNDIDWLLDKKNKCDAIIFNADCENDLLVGYLAGHRDSYYLGTLRVLSKVNNRQIYDVTQMSQILNNLIERYDQRF